MDQRLNRETRVWHSLEHRNILPFLGLCRGIVPSPGMISPLYEHADVHRYLGNRQGECLAVVSFGYICR